MKVANWLVLGLAPTLLVVGAPRVSVAQQQSTSTEKTGWSVGAGTSFGYRAYSAGLMSTGSGRSDANLFYPAVGVLLLERKLNDRLLLALHGHASYENKENDKKELLHSERSAGAAVGLRWIFNPGNTVEASATTQIGGYVIRNKRRYPTFGEEQQYEILTTRKIGISLGFALEKALASNLYLRFESMIATVGWGHGKLRRDIELDDDDTKNEHTDLSEASLAFQPTLLLRLAI